MKRKLLIFILLAILTARAAVAETMIQKGSLAAGLQFAYLNLDSDNSELYLLINPITAKGIVFHLSPFFEYTYKDDRSVGIKLQYLSGTAALDNLTLDLMSDGMTFNFNDIDSRLSRFAGIIYHRNYFALDKRSRIGVIAEESLSYSRTFIDYDHDAPRTKYSTGNKVTLAVSPGIIFFLMNNISVSLTVSMANISYNSVKSYQPNKEPGYRNKFGAKFGIDVTGVNFEIAFHF